MSDLNCPNCGDLLPAQFATAKVATCPSCDTTLFLDGDGFRNAGLSGEMHDAPVLFELGQDLFLNGADYHVLGHVRFDYGRGWWDEFWVQGEHENAWVSVDEGDVILQTPLLKSHRPKLATLPALGTTVISFGNIFRVVETGKATCIAIRGMFSEHLQVGAEFTYANCVGDHGTMLSGEFSSGEPDWYSGTWLDPFDMPSGRSLT